MLDKIHYLEYYTYVGGRYEMYKKIEKYVKKKKRSYHDRLTNKEREGTVGKTP